MKNWSLIMAISYFFLPPIHSYALNACFVDSVGPWSGPIYTGGVVNLDTDFTINPQGTLSGSYKVYDNQPYTGTLTDFRQTGTCSAEFVWHDRFGNGFVDINFAPGQGQFHGAWGAPDPVPTWIFDGFRPASEPLS